MRIAAAFAIACLTAGTASAATADGNARIVGAGGVACSQITSDIASNPAAAAEINSWLMGYATATNRQMADTWDLIGAGGAEGFFAAVQAGCAATPDKNLEAAAFEVLKANYATRTVTVP